MLKLQKRSELKFVSRTILHKQGIIPRILLRNLFPKLDLGFIPLIAQRGQFHAYDLRGHSLRACRTSLKAASASLTAGIPA